MGSELRSTLESVGGFFKSAWWSIGIVAIMLSSAEGVLQVRERLQAIPDIRRNADAYHGAEWRNEYFDELKRSGVAIWQPYSYWRRKPFHGKYIDVDTNGIRATANNLTCRSDARATKVFMFGGSAMWGSGVRDTGTIPSAVAANLDSGGFDHVCVTNLGESGYVTTQEVIRLVNLLRDGSVPQVVIFYDGYNDVFSALQNRVAGLPQNEEHRQLEFNLSQSAAGLSLQLVRNTHVFEGLRHLTSPRFQSNSRDGMVDLAKSVVLLYWRNVQLVMALGAQYRFVPLFYWQPILLDKTHLSPFEALQLAKAQEEVPRTFHSTVLSALPEMRPANVDRFRILAPLVENIVEPLFIDSVHLGEIGNQLIADRIAADIMEQAHRVRPSIQVERIAQPQHNSSR